MCPAEQRHFFQKKTIEYSFSKRRNISLRWPFVNKKYKEKICIILFYQPCQIKKPRHTIFAV